jgi:hypothetical protein
MANHAVRRRAFDAITDRAANAAAVGREQRHGTRSTLPGSNECRSKASSTQAAISMPHCPGLRDARPRRGAIAR